MGTRKKLISIDLDGVLNTYHGDYNPVVISPPRDGVHEFLKNLSEQFIVDIFTSRDSKLVWNWLKEHELYKFINNVTNIKSNYAAIQLDWRLRFTLNTTLQQLAKFNKKNFGNVKLYLLNKFIPCISKINLSSHIIQ